MRIETAILKNLLQNEDYTRKVLPFLKNDYFTEDIMTYLDTYCQTKFLYGRGNDAEPSTDEPAEKNTEG